MQGSPGRNSGSTTRALGRLSLAGTVLLVAFIGYGTNTIALRDLSEQRNLRSAQRTLDATLKLQLDEETGIRGFAATRQRLFLAPYERARVQMPATFGALDVALRTVNVSTSNSQPSSELRAINNRWLRTVAEPLIPGTARRDAMQARGKRLVDAFRSAQSRLQISLQARSETVDDRARRFIAGLTIAGFILAVFLAVMVFSLFRRAVDAERAVLAATEAQRREQTMRNIADAVPLHVWSLDRNGHIEYVNDAWMTYTGLSAQRTSSFWEQLVHPDDRDTVHRLWTHAHDRTLPFEAEFRMRSTLGEYRWFLVTATPLFDDTRRLTSWFGTSTDIHARKAGEARLREAFEREQRASRAFQEAALPKTLPAIEGIAFDAVYRAAGNEAKVGGDWYDIFRLADGRIVFTIGDVLGSGIEAAVTMNAIRNAFRGAAQIFPEPSAMLDAAERTLEFAGHEGMVTAFIGILDPVTMTIAYANAGHPPPLLRDKDGNVQAVEGARGVPLGLRAYALLADTTNTLELDEPSLLIFYTDGLIETRRDVVSGYNALVDALRDDAVGGSAEPAHALLDRLAQGPGADDVAIVSARIESPSRNVRRIEGYAHERWEIVASDERQARDARDQFASILREHGLSTDDVTTAELVFTELIGNVLRHGGDRAQIRIDLSREKPVLHVLDRGRGFTYSPMLPADMLSESGRGVYIIGQLTENFTVVPRPSGGSHARAVLAARTRDPRREEAS